MTRYNHNATRYVHTHWCQGKTTQQALMKMHEVIVYCLDQQSNYVATLCVTNVVCVIYAYL